MKIFNFKVLLRIFFFQICNIFIYNHKNKNSFSYDYFKKKKIKILGFFLLFKYLIGFFYYYYR